MVVVVVAVVVCVDVGLGQVEFVVSAVLIVAVVVVVKGGGGGVVGGAVAAAVAVAVVKCCETGEEEAEEVDAVDDSGAGCGSSLGKTLRPVAQIAFRSAGSCCIQYWYRHTNIQIQIQIHE